MLDPPHCPNCQSVIDLTELWRAAPKSNRGSLLAGNVGIVCPVCGVKLRVLQGRVQVSGFLPYVVALSLGLLATSFFPPRDGSLKPKAAWVCVFAIFVVSFILQIRLIPRLFTLRYVQDGEQVGYPLVTLAENLEKQREALEADYLNQPEPADGPAWRCNSCGEENPGTFNECWKCLAMRPITDA
jgi:hypothetical protein